MDTGTRALPDQEEDKVATMRENCKKFKQRIDKGFPELLDKTELHGMIKFMKENKPKDWQLSPDAQFWRGVERFEKTIEAMMTA